MLCVKSSDPLVQKLLGQKAKNKYRNRKVEIDGRPFASQKEANRYAELKALEKQGIVRHIECQKRFLLQEGFTKNGIRYRPIWYVADFVVTYADGHIEVEDTKGHATEAFRIKHKLFEARYPELELKIL